MQEETKEENMLVGAAGEHRLLNIRPMFLCALYLLLGIFFGYLQAVVGYSAWWMFVLLLLPIVLFFILKSKLRAALMALLLCFMFAFGFFSFSFQIVGYRHTPAYQGTYTVTGRVIEKGKTENGYAVTMDTLSVDGVQEKGRMIAYMVSPYADSVRLSDVIEIKAYLSAEVSLVGDYGFRAENIADNVRFVGTNVQSFRVVGTSFSLGRFLRERMESTLFACMDEQTAAVTAAMLFGDTSAIESGLLENIRHGGIAHIFAVSGLHIGAVFMVCSFLFRGGRLPKILQFLFVAALLLFYGDLCCFSASVIRAIITCLTLYACEVSGWKYDGLECLSLAAVFVFGAYPTLLFGVGAQLSFAACLGIILVQRNLQETLETICGAVENVVLYKILKREKKETVVDIFAGDVPPPSLYEQAKRTICSYVAVSCSAQLFTIPILYHAFGYFSPISFLLNLLFVPLITSIFCILLLFVLVASFFASGISTVILYLPNVVWSALLLLFEGADFTSLAVVGMRMDLSAMIPYYACVSTISDKFNFTRRERCFFLLLFFLLFVATMSVLNF